MQEPSAEHTLPALAEAVFSPFPLGEATSDKREVTSKSAAAGRKAAWHSDLSPITYHLSPLWPRREFRAFFLLPFSFFLLPSPAHALPGGRRPLPSIFRAPSPRSWRISSASCCKRFTTSGC
jgi:hypothetical protein